MFNYIPFGEKSILHLDKIQRMICCRDMKYDNDSYTKDYDIRTT